MPKPFDLFAEFAKYGIQQDISLRDPNALAGFAKHAKELVEQALDDPAFVHGQRTQAMFEAMIVSLGDFALFKPEDIGLVYPADRYAVPDYRVVLNDGAQWLVEVKNVHEDDPSKQERKVMTSAYRARLEEYARATGGELKLAVFWSRWAIWTIVTPEQLVDENGDLILDMPRAMMANELSRLGDRTIGTKPPLRFRVLADPQKTSPMAPDGRVNLTIGDVKFLCGDNEIVDPTEREIAWIFMQHGDWEEIEPEVDMDGDTLNAIEFRWEPAQQQNEGFEIIGSLSRMFTRYYAEMTVERREVIQVNAPIRPGWFAPLVSEGYESKNLPLWKFILQPNHDLPGSARN